MSRLWITIALVAGCQSAPAPAPRPSEREIQLEAELIKAKTALEKAESVIATLRRTAPVEAPVVPVVVEQEDGTLPAECLAYKRAIEKMMTCDKMQAAAGAMKEGFDNMWTQLRAAPPDAQRAMADGCKAGSDAIEQALSAMGC